MAVRGFHLGTPNSAVTVDNEEDIPPYLYRPDIPRLHDATRKESSGEESVLQQDHTLKPFYDHITHGGLAYVHAKTKNLLNAQQNYRKTTSDTKHVIVVGAGMAGLSASFELAQAGHEVTILEVQRRVGGRVKTIRDQFSDNLHSEGGAMRLPPSHFLTKHYIDLFKVKTRPFQNKNKNGYLCFYGDKIKMADWDKNPGFYCNKYWPGWDCKLTESVKSELSINGIDDYFERTTAPVIEELRRDASPCGWKRWVAKWSELSVSDFLRWDIHQNDSDKYKLRPWPEQAILAYKTRNYIPLLESSLVVFLRDEIGQWWGENLYTPTDGMDSLASAFMGQNKHGWNSDVNLSRSTRFGVKVQAIEIVDRGSAQGVKVTGRNEASKDEVTVTADAVIVTVPLTVMRQMKIPLSREMQQAVEGVYYEASTKILLQCRTRFWQREDNLQGGFSKTNLPIGQLHYPDWEESGISPDERGILVVYTWGQEAEMFGAQTPTEAIENAVDQVATIHPEIRDHFEVGAVQAWSNEPSAQGAFVGLRPFQYNSSMNQLLRPEHPIYLAGEGISWSNGWIQGALESGLRAAYQFYSHNEDNK